MADPITTGPNPAPIEATQDVATPDQLQAPAPAPVQQPMQLAPQQTLAAQPVTTPPVAPSNNQRLHGFVSSVLGGIANSMAGKGPTKYTTDAQGRTVADPNQPQESTGDKLRRIGANALAGLNAGARVPQQKSGLASALAGLGAGAAARKEGDQAQDDKARKQEQENAEAVAQKELRMHTIGRGNALTYATYQEQRRLDEDRDPHRAQALGWAKAAEDAGVPVEYATESELQQKRTSDPSFIATHQILPIGMKPVLGPDGQPVHDENGQPKMEGQFALIDGLHNGNISAPESFVSDVQKYGKYAGVTGTENMKPGEDMSMEHFTKLFTAIQDGKKKELEGWSKPELSYTTKPDGSKTPIWVNPNTGDTKPFSSDIHAVPNVEDKTEKSDVKNDLIRAQTDEANAKAKESLANAAAAAHVYETGNQSPEALDALMKSYSSLPPNSRAVLSNTATDKQARLLQLWAGKQDPSKLSTRMDPKTHQTEKDYYQSRIAMFDSTWNENKYKAVSDLIKDATTGKLSAQVNSQNQFLGHAGEAADVISQWKTTQSPYLNKSYNWLRKNLPGDPMVTRLSLALEPVNDEYLNAIKSGKAPTEKESSRVHDLTNADLNVATLLSNLELMGEQVVTRMDQNNEQMKTLNGDNLPNLVHATGLEGAKKIGIAGKLAKYNSGGQFMTGPSSIAPQTSSPTEQPKAAGPAPTSHSFDAKAWAANNPGKDVNAAIAKAKAQGYEVTQ